MAAKLPSRSSSGDSTCPSTQPWGHPVTDFRQHRTRVEPGIHPATRCLFCFNRASPWAHLIRRAAGSVRWRNFAGLPLRYYLDPTVALDMARRIFYRALSMAGSYPRSCSNLPARDGRAVTCLTATDWHSKGQAQARAVQCTAIIPSSGTFAINSRQRLCPGDRRFRAAASARRSIFFVDAARPHRGHRPFSPGLSREGLARVIVGLALGLVGTDVNTGMFRLQPSLFRTGRRPEPSGPLPWNCSVSPINPVGTSASRVGKGKVDVGKINLKSMLPTKAEWRQLACPSALAESNRPGPSVGAPPARGPGNRRLHWLLRFEKECLRAILPVRLRAIEVFGLSGKPANNGRGAVPPSYRTAQPSGISVGDGPVRWHCLLRRYADATASPRAQPDRMNQPDCSGASSIQPSGSATVMLLSSQFR